MLQEPGPSCLPGALTAPVLWNAGCNIALYYYSGFCYLQLRRYTDAARAFNSVLTYIARCGVLQRCRRLAVLLKGFEGLSHEYPAWHEHCCIHCVLHLWHASLVLVCVWRTVMPLGCMLQQQYRRGSVHLSSR